MFKSIEFSHVSPHKRLLMDFLDRYPAGPAVASLCAGITAAHYGELRCISAMGVFVAASIGATWAAFRWGKPIHAKLAVITLLFTLGAYQTAYYSFPEPQSMQSARDKAVRAKIHSLLSSTKDGRVFLLSDATELDSGKPLQGFGRFVLRDYQGGLNYGDEIAFRSKIKVPQNRGNPGEYDWEGYCLSEGIFWQASAQGQDSVIILSRGSPDAWRSFIFRLRARIIKFIETHSTGRERAALKGIVAGDTGEIDPELMRSYIDSGLCHTLSASGQHITIIAGLVALLIAALARVMPVILLHMPFRKWVAFACIPAIVIYCLLVGARAPPIRATIMGATVCVAVLGDRPWLSLNTLAVAAALILLSNPYALFTPGFQLSFSAVFGIIFAVPPFMDYVFNAAKEEPAHVSAGPTPPSRTLRFIRYFVGIAVTTVAATAGTTPILAYFFGAFAGYTLPANLIGGPLVAVGLSLGITASFLGVLHPDAGGLLLTPAVFAIRLLNQTAEYFAALPRAMISIPWEGVKAPLILVFPCVALLLWLRRPARDAFAIKMAAVGVLPPLILSAWDFTKLDTGILEAVFFNVGKADAAYVRPPGSRGFLIDGGLKNEFFDSGDSVILPFLRWKGVNSLDAVCISHADMDHIGGLFSTLKRIPTEVLYFNQCEGSGDEIRNLFDIASAKGAGLCCVDGFYPPVSFGDVTVRFFNPTVKDPSRESHRVNFNDTSLCMRIEYGQVSFLFTGDLEREGEAALLASGADLRATILKVGHHGSKTSSGRSFLEAVRPKYAIISAGDSPYQRGPSKEVRERLQSAGAEVLWTGRDGAVIVETDGNAVSKVSVRTMRNRDSTPDRKEAQR